MKVIYKILYTSILQMKALHILGLAGQQTCDNCVWLNKTDMARYKIQGSDSSNQ
jgi:hypothetical protein